MESSPASLFQLSGQGAAPTSVTELQKLLIEKTMNNEQHKTLYLQLKEEHNRLTADYIKSQTVNKQLLAEKQRIEGRYEFSLSELQEELLDKTKKLEELKLHVLTPHKLDLLKLQIQQEVQASKEEHLKKLYGEAEEYRAECNKLRYENANLKSELEHQFKEQISILEEQKLKYEAEITQLERDKEELNNQIMSIDPTKDSKRVEDLLGEKVQLCQKVKSLKAEVTELRAERDQYGVQAESVQRTQMQQMTETQAAIRSLEVEKQHLNQQLEGMKNQLQENTEENYTLSKKLQKSERDVRTLAIRIDQLKHSQKIEIDEIKLEAARIKKEAEKDKDRIQSQLDVVENENEILKATLERHKELLAGKDREVVRKVQAAREAEIQQIASIEDKRMELENKVTELEKNKVEQDQQMQTQKRQLEEKLRIAQSAEKSVRQQLQSLRSQLEEKTIYIEQIKKENHNQTDLKQEIKSLHTQVTSLSESENNLIHENKKLQEMVDRLKQENLSIRNQLERIQQDAEKELEGKQIEWLQEKHKLQEDLFKIQEKYKAIREKLQRAAQAQKKRKTIHENRCIKFKEKIELLEAKKEELETEKSVLNRQNISQEDYVRLKKRLADLQRRHNEFRTLILGPNTITSGFLNPIGCMSSTMVPEAESSFHNAQEQQHQQELSMLRKRLEELENTQMKQLEELGPSPERCRIENSGPGNLHRNTEEEENSETVKSHLQT